MLIKEAIKDFLLDRVVLAQQDIQTKVPGVDSRPVVEDASRKLGRAVRFARWLGATDEEIGHRQTIGTIRGAMENGDDKGVSIYLEQLNHGIRS